jgi:hypothetical protein
VLHYEFSGWHAAAMLELTEGLTDHLAQQPGDGMYGYSLRSLIGARSPLGSVVAIVKDCKSYSASSRRRFQTQRSRWESRDRGSRDGNLPIAR